jgi:hypothetical protein
LRDVLDKDRPQLPSKKRLAADDDVGSAAAWQSRFPWKKKLNSRRDTDLHLPLLINDLPTYLPPHRLLGRTLPSLSRFLSFSLAYAMGYIRASELPHLREYKYSGVDRSLVSRYVLKPFYTNVVIRCFPMWMA